MHLTLVSCKKVSTASVACTSSNILRTEGGAQVFPATRLPYPIPCLAWGAQALHLAIRWNLDCRSPLLHHQYSLLAILPTLSHRYEEDRGESSDGEEGGPAPP